jgi:hypothetical protein
MSWRSELSISHNKRTLYPLLHFSGQISRILVVSSQLVKNIAQRYMKPFVRCVMSAAPEKAKVAGCTSSALKTYCEDFWFSHRSRALSSFFTGRRICEAPK